MSWELIKIGTLHKRDHKQCLSPFALPGVPSSFSISPLCLCLHSQQFILYDSRGSPAQKKRKIYWFLLWQIGLVAYSSNNCTLCAVAAGLSIRCKCSAHWHVIISVTSWSFSISGCLHGALTYRICINCCVYHTLDPHPTYPPLPKKMLWHIKTCKDFIFGVEGDFWSYFRYGFSNTLKKINHYSSSRSIKMGRLIQHRPTALGEILELFFSSFCIIQAETGCTLPKESDVWWMPRSSQSIKLNPGTWERCWGFALGNP